MYQKFLNHIQEKSLFDSSQSLLLAMSGGVDSMVLADLLLHFEYKFSVAHINHKTRNGESDRDAEFVYAFCEQNNIQLHTMELGAVPDNENFQAFARRERYTYMLDLGYDKILTAHHSDDNVETILLHFFSGRSVRPIPLINQSIVRPLLPFGKDELIRHAFDNQIAYVEDSSNALHTYDRNFIRHKIIPELESHFTKVKKRIIQLSANIVADQELLELCASEILALSKKEEKILIPKDNLTPTKELLLYHAIKFMGFNLDQCADIINGIDRIGNQFLSDRYTLVVDREHLIIAPTKNSSLLVYCDLTVLPAKTTFNNYNFLFALPQGQNWDEGYNSILVSKEKIGQQLIIRTWRDGDRIYPRGMKGHSQSLKKFFANQKVDRIHKHEIPILTTNDGRIIWIAGYRQDERFMVDDHTSSEDKLIITVNRSN